MSGRRRGRLSDIYGKGWNPVFLEDRGFKEDGSWVELKRKMGAVGDDLDLFLEDFESSVPSCQVQEVQEFCQSVHLNDLQSELRIAYRRRGAWLDDRSSEGSRKHTNPPNSNALYRLLKLPRYDIKAIPDADRRLIYIPDLDPYYILALTETASFHQIPALRDAIWKYIALQTSIRVRIPVTKQSGFPIFHLEFHIPYFALRPTPLPDGCRREQGNPRSNRRWSDLTFLDIWPPNSQGQKQYGMHEAQISFVLCGSDHQRWVAYAFVDTDFEEDDVPDEIVPDEQIREVSVPLDDELGVAKVPIWDPIALDGGLDANLPIWDPRLYFLVILEIRMAQVLREWEFLVRTVERSISRYRTLHGSTLSPPSERAGHRAHDTKHTFDWTLQTMKLLIELIAAISKLIKAWENFNSSNGDIGYLIDSVPGNSHCRTRLSLRAVKDTFETMEGLQQTLFSLEKVCRDSADALNLRLTVEGNESLRQSNESLRQTNESLQQTNESLQQSKESIQDNSFAADFTLLILSPFALAVALFSIPQALMPFELSFKSFFVATLIIMAVIRLLFLALPRSSKWRPKLVAWVWKWQLHAIAYGRLVISRGAHPPAPTEDVVELETLEV